MKNFKVLTYSSILIISLISFTSCKKFLIDKFTDKINEAIGSMSCTVDGKKYTDFTATNISSGGQLYAEGVAKLSTKPITISIIIESKVDSGKTYLIDSSKVEINWKNLSLNSSVFSTTNKGGTGSITILKSNDKLIEGTFFGTLYEKDKKDSKVVIKNGSFLVKNIIK